MAELILNTHDTARAGQYVFACGPWLGKVFPEVMGVRMRTPIGRICYFATPHGDDRFAWPNMPSFNFPGVTGWPTLPFDSRGLRVRGGGGGGGGRGGGGGAVAPAAGPPIAHSRPDPTSAIGMSTRSRWSGPGISRRAYPADQGQPLNETRACHYEQSVSRNYHRPASGHPERLDRRRRVRRSVQVRSGDRGVRGPPGVEQGPGAGIGGWIPHPHGDLRMVAPAPASRAGGSGDGEAG